MLQVAFEASLGLAVNGFKWSDWRSGIIFFSLCLILFKKKQKQLLKMLQQTVFEYESSQGYKGPIMTHLSF